jgi:hypothetical protein
MPGSYAPDNEPIEYERKADKAIELHQPVDKAGMQKTMRVQLAESDTKLNRSIGLQTRMPGRFVLSRGRAPLCEAAA